MATSDNTIIIKFDDEERELLDRIFERLEDLMRSIERCEAVGLPQTERDDQDQDWPSE